MSENVDIQYFSESSGMWVKPPRAVRVDCILRGGEAGRNILTGHPSLPADPEIRLVSFAADDLPDQVPVTVGRGGGVDASSSGGPAYSIVGANGFALFLTHLAPADAR